MRAGTYVLIPNSVVQTIGCAVDSSLRHKPMLVLLSQRDLVKLNKDAFTAEGRFCSGNLPGHSTMSDGAWSPEQVCSAYRNHGYDFIALPDHLLKSYSFPITDTKAFRQDGFTTILGGRQALSNPLWFDQ